MSEVIRSPANDSEASAQFDLGLVCMIGWDVRRPVPQLATRRRGNDWLRLEILWNRRPHRQLTKVLLAMVRPSTI